MAVFSEIASTTLKNYMSTLVNNVLDSNALIGRLREKNNMIVDGGESLVQPVKFQKSASTQSFSGYDTLNIDPQRMFDAFQFEWKGYNASITYTDEEINKNSGKSRAINLIDSRIQATEMDLMSQLNEDLYLDGTGNGGKNITGLALHIADLPTSGTYGGFDRATYTWARNQYAASSGAWGSLTNQYGRADLDTAHLATRRGKDMADLVLMGDTAWAKLKKEFQASELVNAEFKQIKGFGNIDMKYNNMDIVRDEMCGAAKSYIINSKYLKLIISKNYNFKVIEAIRPNNQAAFVQHIRVFLELVGSNPSKQYVITSVS